MSDLLMQRKDLWIKFEGPVTFPRGAPAKGRRLTMQRRRP